MDVIRNDLRYSVRALLRAPLFTIVVVFILALGIGANSASFSIIEAVLLRPLPYPEPDRLITVWQSRLDAGPETVRVAPGNFLDWREQTDTLAELVAFFIGGVTLTQEEEFPERLTVAAISPGFFSVLRQDPFLGRPFTPEEAIPGNDKVAVLGHGLWSRRFASDPGIVGRTVTLDGERYAVVGLMPAGFEYPAGVDLWVPYAIPEAERTNRGSRFLTVVGRLASGTSLEQARTELETIAARLARQFPETNEGWGTHLVPLHEHTVGDVRSTLLMFQGAVLLMLLLACINAANLQVARTTVRLREMALRAALGAGRRRLMREVSVESGLLALAGGALGLLLAWGAILFAVTVKGREVPRLGEVEIDAATLGITLLVTAGTAVALGLVTVVRVSRLELAESLKEGEGKATGGGVKVREGLVVAEVALALVLLAAAGLLLSSLVQLLRVEPGFDPEGVLTARIYLPSARYGETGQMVAFFDQITEDLRRLPAVETVGLINARPATGTEGIWNNGFEIEGHPPASSAEMSYSYLRWISGDYFEAMGIPLLRGRTFAATDTATSPRVAIIDEVMAQRFFPDRDPVGRRLIIHLGDLIPWEIVGIAGAVREVSLDLPPEPHMYIHYPQAPFVPGLSLVVRSAIEPEGLIAAVRERVASLDPELPVYQVETMEARLAGTLVQERFNLFLLGVFATVALLLAAAGIYGVIAYSVSRRTREIGIRLAVGATSGDVLGMVLRRGMTLVGVGLGLGLSAALGLSPLLREFLYEVSPADPVTLTGAAVLLMLVALVATYIPARRATRVDPTAALRYE